MATKTPFTHKSERVQLRDFYPHEATFKDTDSKGKQNKIILVSKCAYEPYQPNSGSDGGELETEPIVGDQLLLPSWYPQIRSTQLVVLKFPDGTEQRFTVLDRAPEGEGPNRTLVLMKPT